MSEEKSLKNIRVLVVEDVETTRKLLHITIQEFDCQIDLVCNGQEALDKLKENSYDIVLMDIFMPVMDGLVATTYIRRDEKLKDLPIVAVTGLDEVEYRKICYAAGMNDFLEKPIDVDKLREVLIRHVRQ